MGEKECGGVNVAHSVLIKKGEHGTSFSDLA
jgi:hypothetical protein